ncbi:MAG TPA: hypothetical protein VN948_16535 [Terriglobales bacterium]|nr:hypothetical protein [Terriglobales bacterium]
MKREERVLKIPPLAISVGTADALLEELSTLARRNSEFEQRLRAAYKADRAGTPQLDPEARSEDEFVRRNLANPDLWAMANIPTYQNYIFLTKSGNVSFDGADFTVADLPKDIFFLKARADGLNGRFIELQLKTDFSNFNDVRDWKTRQLLVQGEDRNWVTGVYERLKLLVDSECLHTRNFIYGNVLKVFWFSILLVLFAEYRTAKWFSSNFSLTQPLSGTGALAMFGILLATLIVVAELGIAMLTHWFPYFEIEGNISRSRTASRKIIVGIATTIYTGAIVNALALALGPAFAGWIGQY